MSSRCPSNNIEGEECGTSPECSKDCYLDTESGSNSSLMEDSSIQLRFPIFVESMTGTTFKLDVFPSDTILQIKEQLENTEGIPVCQQHIIFNYRELTNDNTIEETSIEVGARLRLVVDLTTGPISGTPLILDSKQDNEEECSEGELNECRPLTLLLYQNGDQIKLISISTTKTNGCCDHNSIDSQKVSNNSLSNESSQLREEENRQMKEKINEIQNKLKTLQLKRKENSKQIDINNSNDLINSGKLPHLDTISVPKEFKNGIKTELHLPPISGESKSDEKPLNDWTGIEREFNFIKQLLMPSIDDMKTILYERRHSLTSNNRFGSVEDEKSGVESVDPFQSVTNNLISKLRPLTAPAVNDLNENHINLMNKLRRVSAQKQSNILWKHRNSAKTNRLKSGRRLPPILINSKKKVNKIRCSYCRIKLGIVNRYKCRCGLVFCVKHRYSETHLCTYDYKEEGNKLIRINNPVVIPEKLPKI